jgi:hypothetical protein
MARWRLFLYIDALVIFMFTTHVTTPLYEKVAATRPVPVRCVADPPQAPQPPDPARTWPVARSHRYTATTDQQAAAAVGERYAAALAALQEEASRLQAAHGGDRRLRTLNADPQSLRSLAAMTVASFEEEGRRLQEKGLPSIVIERHHSMVAAFETKQKAFEQIVEQIEAAKAGGHPSEEVAATGALLAFFQHFPKRASDLRSILRISPPIPPAARGGHRQVDCKTCQWSFKLGRKHCGLGPPSPSRQRQRRSILRLPSTLRSRNQSKSWPRRSAITRSRSICG